MYWLRLRYVKKSVDITLCLTLSLSLSLSLSFGPSPHSLSPPSPSSLTHPSCPVQTPPPPPLPPSVPSPRPHCTPLFTCILPSTPELPAVKKNVCNDHCAEITGFWSIPSSFPLVILNKTAAASKADLFCAIVAANALYYIYIFLIVIVILYSVVRIRKMGMYEAILV